MKTLKEDLIAVITKAYYPKDFTNWDSVQVSRFIKKMNRWKKADLVSMANTATYVLEDRGE